MGPLKVIPIESLETIQARYNTPEWTEEPETWPEGRLDDFVALYRGRAVLVLPDGKRYWLPVVASELRCNLPGPAGEALLRAVLDHDAFARHWAYDVFFDYDTNSLNSAFCTGCGRLVDLTEDVRKMDESGRRDQ